MEQEKPLNFDPIRFSPISAVVWVGTVLWVGAIAWWHRRVVMDDPWITFRYAENLLAGRGLVFNEGEWIEGYSNPTWVLISAVGMFLRIEPLSFTRFLGFASLAAILGLFAFGWHWLSRSDEETAPFPQRSRIAALFTAGCYPLAVWSIGGLETMFYTALLTLFAMSLAIQFIRSNAVATTVASLTLALLVLTRPEAFFWIAVPVLLLLLTRIKKVPATGFLIITAVGAVTFLGLLAFRMSLYGELLPNSVTAKVGGGPLATIWNGLVYAVSTLWGGMLLLLALLIWAKVKALVSLVRSKSLCEENQFLAVLLLFIGLQLAFTIAVGGDWMPAGRFIVPILPLLALAAAVTIWRWHGFVKVTLAGFLILASLIEVRQNDFLRWCRWAAKEQGGQMIVEPLMETGRQLRALAPNDGALFAATEAGVMPYVSGLRFIDMLGLVDSHIANLPGGLHEKFDAEYVLSREPDFIVLAETETAEGNKGSFLPDRQLLETEAFREQYSFTARVPRKLNDGNYHTMQDAWMVIYSRNETATTP